MLTTYQYINIISTSFTKNNCKIEIFYIAGLLSKRTRMIVSVISGGSRGIGGSLARNFSNLGMKVFYSYKNKIGLENESVFPIQADCTREVEIEKFRDYVGQSHKHIHLLVNNLGIAKFELLANQTNDDFNQSLNTNVWSMIKITQKFAPLLAEGSTIINIGSISSRSYKRGNGLYSMTKAMMESCAKSFAQTFKDKKINVLTILPGFVLTEALQQEKYVQIRDDNLKGTPLKRFATPDEIGQSIAMLTLSGTFLKEPLVISGGQHLT